MIVIQLNRRDFEYDIHSLVKAFYPGSDVMICCEEEGASKDAASEAELKISVFYEEKQIRIEFAAGQDTGAQEKAEGQAGAPGEVLQQKESGKRSGQIPLENPDDRKERKNQLKKLLYQMLLDYTGQKLPWGN
ncbi:MAG: hypothetical protein PHE06_14690, partial [Lachnospiraceae bacterium]|nr:hypothetical protein [Lachnospiraceae bacterium]